MSCQSRLDLRESHIAKQITIESLTVLNLSEDMNELSTQNDEILLLFTLLKKETNQFKAIDNQTVGRFIFNKNGTNRKINKTVELAGHNPDSTYLIFSLVELDNENFNKTIPTIILEELIRGTFLKDFDKKRMNQLLGHDDFLDLEYRNLSTLYSGRKIIVSFKGFQMFDKFEYLLNLKFH